MHHINARRNIMPIKTTVNSDSDKILRIDFICSETIPTHSLASSVYDLNEPFPQVPGKYSFRATLALSKLRR